jgi:hypothetical protein
MNDGLSSASPLRASIAHLGYRRTAQRAAYRLLNRSVGFSLLHCARLSLDQLRPESLQLDSPYTFRFLEPEEVLRLAAESANNLSRSFVATALEKGDECLACLDGDVLACMGWYSRRPTRVARRIEVHFDPKYAYLHHGYALPAYRGQRLHAAGLARACQSYTDRGAAGLVTLYPATNYASRILTERMGWQRCGSLYSIGFGRLSVMGATLDCASVGFRLERCG